MGLSEQLSSFSGPFPLKLKKRNEGWIQPEIVKGAHWNFTVRMFRTYERKTRQKILKWRSLCWRSYVKDGFSKNGSDCVRKNAFRVKLGAFILNEKNSFYFYALSQIPYANAHMAVSLCKCTYKHRHTCQVILSREALKLQSWNSVVTVLYNVGEYYFTLISFNSTRLTHKKPSWQQSR